MFLRTHGFGRLLAPGPDGKTSGNSKAAATRDEWPPLGGNEGGDFARCRVVGLLSVARYFEGQNLKSGPIPHRGTELPWLQHKLSDFLAGPEPQIIGRQ